MKQTHGEHIYLSYRTSVFIYSNLPSSMAKHKKKVEVSSSHNENLFYFI